MKKFELRSRKMLRALFGGISLTTVAFIFQACYGTPYDFGYDIKITGTVKSKTSKLPIKGIKVSRPNSLTYEITDEKGNFSFYTFIDDGKFLNDSTSAYLAADSIPISFSDIDGIENGNFCDTTIIINPARKDEVKMNVELKEKK